MIGVVFGGVCVVRIGIVRRVLRVFCLFRVV